MKLFFATIACSVFVTILVGVGLNFAKLNTENYAIQKNNGSIKAGASKTQEHFVFDAPSVPKVKAIFVGDIMLDRNVRIIVAKQKNFNYPFELADEMIKNFDIRIGNLEGPVTKFDPVAEPGGILRFTISPNFLNALSERFDALSLANNHMLDFGQEGYSQTKNFLDQKNIKWFGNGKNAENELSAIINKNGISIGLVGYHGLWDSNTDKIIDEIQNIKKSSDFVVVYPHWGNEYQKNPSTTQQKQAHEFIDAGADLIIGSHPHVVQTIEIYNNKAIFYSLGNFVFDQYWSEETMRSLAVGLELKKEKNWISQALTLYPLDISNSSQPHLASEPNYSDTLNWLSESANASDNIKEEIKNGKITITAQ